MIVGCYTLDLYCDHSSHVLPVRDMEQYTGRTFSDCMRQAKKLGWLFRLKKSPQEAICPECRKKKVEDAKPCKS